MLRSTSSSISFVLAAVFLCNSILVFAATENVVARHAAPHASPDRVSNRLIVKFKPDSLMQGISVSQINTQLSQPLSAGVVVQLQAAANISLSELQATSNGAHVLSLAGQPTRQAVNNAIAGIGSLSNVEYVEEDRILTAQAVPNDSFYLTVTNGATTYPGLWGMWPVNAASSVGNPSSYGADFQTAWGVSAGTGVVVAVVDTGITPNIDIVGINQVVAAGGGSNLVSVGYDFISDCRIRGVTSTGGCAASTPTPTATPPTADATDTGDYVTVQDNIDNPTLFPAPTPPKTLPVNSSWHGTIVAGIVAALGNNHFGVIGGAYNAKILPVRVLGKGGGLESDIANGVRWAAGVYGGIANPNPAKVINLSVGVGGACSITMQSAIDAAVAAGAVVVVAAGNQNIDVANATPANCHNVISVAATGRDGSRASYSNFSSPSNNITNPTTVTLAAPGGDDAQANPTYDPGIWSTWNAGTTVQSNTAGSSAFAGAYGTSMAAPHVSAVAALMLAKNPSLTPAQIKTILSTTASLTAFPSFVSGSYQSTNLTDCTTLNNCGAGILNAALALQNTPAAPAAAPAVSSGGGGGCAITPPGTNPDASLLLALLAVTVYWLRRRVVRDRNAD